MNHTVLRRTAIAAVCACWPLAALAEEIRDPMNVVVVRGPRAAPTSFDLPAAGDVVDAAQIGDTQLRVNASEALVAVPGIV
ncbi:hypothetical protein K3V90_14810, partial [Listeria monocytogenes]|nr:hypothetical protein [Listeria monocytogenes]